MKRINFCLNLKKDFFYCIFAFWYLSELILSANTDTIFKIPINNWNEIVSWTVFIFLIIQILFLQRYSLSQFLIILGITFFIVISVCISHNRTILSAWMFVVAAKNIDFDKTIILARNILFIIVSGIIIFRFVGILDERIIYRLGTVRYSLGFAHPNQLGLRVFQFVLCNVYLKRKSIGFKEMAMVLAAAIFCYKVPNSQTASLSLAALFILLGGYLLITRYAALKSRMFVNGMTVAAVAANIGSVALSIIDVTKYPILNVFDRLLSARFSYGHICYLIYGVKMFGNRVYISEEERALVGITQYLFLDSSYMNLILRYGILTYLIYSGIYLLNMIKQKNEGNDIMVIILFLYAIYGIMEGGLYSITHNIFILTLSFLIYSRDIESRYKIIWDKIIR